MTVETVHRQCNLCEAHCGLRIQVEGADVVRIEGDPDDHMSKGYICPKAAALVDLYTDPDRLRKPIRKTGLRVGGDGVGRRARLRRRRPQEGPRPERARRRRDLLRQPGRARLVDPRRGDPARGDRRPQPLLGDLDRPASPAPNLGGDVRQPRALPDPRHRSHRLHARPRRQPLGLQWLPDDRAGGAPPAARHRQAGRDRRRGRPAPDRDGHVGLPPPGGSPGRRRPPAARRPPRDLRRGPRRRSRDLHRRRRGRRDRRRVDARSARPPSPASPPPRSSGSPASSPRRTPPSPTGAPASASSAPARSSTG